MLLPGLLLLIVGLLGHYASKLIFTSISLLLKKLGSPNPKLICFTKGYYAIECLFIALSLYLYCVFGLTWQLLFWLTLSWFLLIAAFIDLKTYLLPDVLTLPVIVLGLMANTWHLYCPLSHAILGCIIGYLFFAGIARVLSKLKQLEVMGGGDYKLLAGLGAWFGWEMLPAVVLIASLTGSLIGAIYILATDQDMEVQIPFGPFLSFAGLTVMIWQPDLFHL